MTLGDAIVIGVIFLAPYVLWSTIIYARYRASNDARTRSDVRR